MIRLPTKLTNAGPPPQRYAARALLASVSAALLLGGCMPAPHPGALAQVRARHVLRVVTLNAPTSYYLGAHGAQGFEFRLASGFAHGLGVSLQIDPVLDAAAMRAALAEGRADMAAAQLTADAHWREFGIATAPYRSISQLVVQAHDRPHARNITGLVGARVVVRADSPQAAQLRAMRAAGIAQLTWTEQPAGGADPLELLERGQADYAVVDADEFAFARHIYPDVIVDFELPDTRPAQWIVRPDGADLAAAADRFIAEARDSGLLAQIQNSAQAESADFDYLQAHRFEQDITRRLPQLQDLFQRAALATGLDWRLLAAVGYQESKWQMQAVSDDGAEGIMMLTSDAATRVGVRDRTNQWQNILGGARYLAEVIRTIPSHVPEPDHTWLALAAYNVGYGHLEDARVLTQKLGKNPDSWQDVREQLPLLGQQQWYQHARRGYARGWEPAGFVEQVRQYLSVLEWFDTTQLSMRTSQREVRAALAAPGSRYD